MLTVRITKGSDYYYIKLTGDESAFRFAIQSLKDGMHPIWRRYIPAAKLWRVSLTQDAELYTWLDELETYDLDAKVIWDEPKRGSRRASRDNEESPPTRPEMMTTPHTTLHLLPSAPPELIKAAYKCLVTLYHPDVGGDHDQMVALNRAYELLRTP